MRLLKTHFLHRSLIVKSKQNRIEIQWTLQTQPDPFFFKFFCARPPRVTTQDRLLCHHYLVAVQRAFFWTNFSRLVVYKTLFKTFYDHWPHLWMRQQASAANSSQPSTSSLPQQSSSTPNWFLSPASSTISYYVCFKTMSRPWWRKNFTRADLKTSIPNHKWKILLSNMVSIRLVRHLYGRKLASFQRLL